MYDFRDIGETVDSAFLPSEALQINGEYIENLVEGYRTLAVSGRESLSPEIDTFETGIRDGSQIKSKRYPERTIVVKYQLIAATNEAFREAYNTLGAVLNVTEAQLIFADEPDKYFTGTPSAIGEVDPGTNAVVAEFEILCADPFKYSVFEYEAEASLDDKSILLDYGGTYKAYPTLEADFHQETEVSEDGETAQALTGNGDCGYVAFYTEDEKIIQLGDPEEQDGVNDIPKSQTLVNQTFLNSSAWGTAAQDLWSANDGVTAGHDVAKAGSVAMSAARMNYVTTTTGAAGTTSKRLIAVNTGNSGHVIQYVATAKTYGRTSSSVKVKVTVACKYISAPKTNSVQGMLYTNRVLRGGVYIGGAWRRFTIKAAGKIWSPGNSYTANAVFTITGLSASSTALTGIRFEVERTDSNAPTGAGELAATNCPNIPISTYSTTTTVTEAGIADYYLAASDYGSGDAWHGPTITRTLGTDASGEVGAENFTFTYRQKLCYADTYSGAGQQGDFQVLLSDATGRIVAGIRVYKLWAGNDANLYFYVNGQVVDSTKVDIYPGNTLFGAKEEDVRTNTIRKSGSSIFFTVGDDSRVFTDAELTSVMVTKITFGFFKYGTRAPLEYNGIYWAKFVKDNCNTWREIPNKFSASDVVQADCRPGKIYLNGIYTPDLGALGNDWEDFFLTPGLNQIGFSYSDWVTDAYAPTIKVKWREAFL